MRSFLGGRACSLARSWRYDPSPQQKSFDLVIALIPSLECPIHERTANNHQLGPFHEGMDHIAPASLP
jgi:hypothetical protein